MRKAMHLMFVILITLVFIWMVLSVIDIGFNAISDSTSKYNFYKIMYESTKSWR